MKTLQEIIKQLELQKSRFQWLSKHSQADLTTLENQIHDALEIASSGDNLLSELRDEIVEIKHAIQRVALELTCPYSDVVRNGAFLTIKWDFETDKPETRYRHAWGKNLRDGYEKSLSRYYKVEWLDSLSASWV